MKYCLWGHRRGYEQLRLPSKHHELNLWMTDCVCARRPALFGEGHLYIVMTRAYARALYGENLIEGLKRFCRWGNPAEVSTDAVLHIPAAYRLETLWSTGLLCFRA